MNTARHPLGKKGSLFCDLVARLVPVEDALFIADQWKDAERAPGVWRTNMSAYRVQDNLLMADFVCKVRAYELEFA